jgi:DNA adenine methylase
MKYVGSKSRLAKYIIPIMIKDRKKWQAWVEPFVGGGNIIDKVDGKRIGADINPHTIQALITIRDYADKLPKNNKEFTKNDYKNLRYSDDYEFKGYAGFTLSWGSKWLCGWRFDKENRDYVKSAYNSALKQSIRLQGVELLCCSYQDLKIPEKSLIYCDPPYQNTHDYKIYFDYDVFWNWCREKANKGHTVYISELSAPKDFKCIFEKKIINKLKSSSNKQTIKRIEKLFKYEK